MKQMRVCIERRRQGSREGQPMCSEWIEDTTEARADALNIVRAGNRKCGQATHWIEDRERVFGGVAKAARSLLWAQEPRADG